MGSVGDRLKEERARLGLSQEAVAAAADHGRAAQLRYEKGERAPDTDYLAAIAALGIDVGYVVTGVASALQPDEAELLSRYRAATADFRTAALAVLSASTTAQTMTARQISSVSGASDASPITVHGDQRGNILTGGQKVKKMTFNVGATGKKKRGPAD